jgi:hypothetical protein
MALSLTELSQHLSNKTFLTSTIIGATSLLVKDIETINVTLSEDILNSIDAVQAIIPDPAP